MKTINLVGAAAVAGLLALSGTNVSAQVSHEIIQPLNFKLLAQAETNWSLGSVTKYKLVSTKVDTKTMLSLLEAATTNAPGAFFGASLVVVNFGDAVQVRRGTNILADVSDFIETDTSDDVSSGAYDDNTGKDTYFGYYTQSLYFNDNNGHQFTLSGLIKETFTASAADADYVRKISDSVVFSASGTGTWDGEYIVLRGSITAKGKGTDIW
jgi:hypothetical protein